MIQNNEFGPNVGFELAKQGLSVKTSNHRMVAIRVDNAAEHRLTVPATIRQQGILIEGPSMAGTGLEHKSYMCLRCRAYRWVLYPVRLSNHNRIYKPGTIVPVYELGMSCPDSDCDYVKRIWLDKFCALESHKNEISNLPKDRRVSCPKCAREGRETTLQVVRFKNTMFRGYKPSNPIYESADDPEIDTLYDAWCGEIKHTPLLLPRIWAVYKEDAAPTDWAPNDEQAARLEERARSQKCTLRPIKIAMQAKSVPIVTAVLEVPTTLKAGWVTEAELQSSGDIGFNRKFIRVQREIKL